MYKTAMAVSLVLVLAAPLMSADTPPDSISWVHSYEEGMALAKKTDRHLVVDFFTPT